MNYMEKLRRILLIDDDSICSWLNKTILENMEVVENIDCISDGNSAITYLQQACTQPSDPKDSCPDLVFLDLNMPGTDGFQVLDELQKTKNGEWLIQDRVIVLTTSISKVDLQKANTYNIHNYLVKPLTESKIKAAIEHYIKQTAEKESTDLKPLTSKDKAFDRAPAERPATNTSALQNNSSNTNKDSQ